MNRRIEMIEEYIVQQSDETDYDPPSYIWTDNKGQLVRCSECIYRDTDDCKWRADESPDDDDYCSIAERECDER